MFRYKFVNGKISLDHVNFYFSVTQLKTYQLTLWMYARAIVFLFAFPESRYQYDYVLQRLSAHKRDCWRGIAPSDVHFDYNPTPPIFAAKFSNSHNHRNVIAIANEDGKVKSTFENKTYGTSTH